MISSRKQFLILNFLSLKEQKSRFCLNENDALRYSLHYPKRYEHIRVSNRDDIWWKSKQEHRAKKNYSITWTRAWKEWLLFSMKEILDQMEAKKQDQRHGVKQDKRLWAETDAQEFPPEHKEELLYCMVAWELEQTAQRDCGGSLTGHFQKLSWCDTVQCALGQPCLSRRLD